MNIFLLDDDPRLAAQAHLDKHIVKMLIEYAQLLSTAHRVLDGAHTTRISNDRKKQFWLLRGERLVSEDNKLVIENPSCYSASHIHHPCGVWTRASDSNYRWLYQLFLEAAAEYTHRYGKIHKSWSDLKDFLKHVPLNIPTGPRTPFALAMGDEFKVPDDPIASYRNYYLGPKAAFARWTNRKPPSWFISGTKDYDATNFERTR